MADVDNTPQQPETLGTVGNGNENDVTNEPEKEQDPSKGDPDAEKQPNGSGIAEEGDKDGEKTAAEGDSATATTVDDDNNNNNTAAAAVAATEPSADSGEAGGDEGPSGTTKEAEGDEETGGAEDKNLQGEGEDKEQEQQEATAPLTTNTTNEEKQNGDDVTPGAETEAGGDGSGGGDSRINKDASAAEHHQQQQKQHQHQRQRQEEAAGEEEGEKDHDGDGDDDHHQRHEPPTTPTFSSSDRDEDEDDTARGQAAEALEKAVEGSEDADAVEETAIAAITAATAAGGGGGGGASGDAGAASVVARGGGGDGGEDESLVSSRTPRINDGMVATSTTIKRLTNTPLGGAGPPAKPRTSQLPPVARGQVRGQQMTSSISDALQYAGQPSPKMLIRSRRPPKYIRLATVTVSPARSRPLAHGPSLYYEEPKRPKKVITWDEANNARPPLRIDMEGPTACSYTPRVKPLNETNAPSFTFGSKCSPEKSGGARTSWSKSWFQTPHVWHTKVDFTRDNNWPSPNHYPKTSGLGPRQRTMPEAPSYTFGHKTAFSIIKPGAPKEPSPNEYKRQTADKIVLPQGPSFTHQLRREGTTLWGSTEVTPGPAAYTPSKPSAERPSFTIQGIRREKSHFLGPYSAL